MKRVLITGANSYIGCSFEEYLLKWPMKYRVDVLDMLDANWESFDFSAYDAILHVAGIAHIKETPKNKNMYYEVNRDLAIKVANKAKSAKVKNFILLSSMSVYGLLKGKVTKETAAFPNSAYGASKFLADNSILSMSDSSFKVAVLRPPMVYGKGCKGNYQQLRKFVLKTPVFPDYSNERSMIFIGNLCEFIKNTLDNQSSGVFFPQNKEYVRTSEMARLIARENGKNLRLSRIFNPFIRVFPFKVLDKVFGTLIYEKIDTVDKYSFEESVMLSENGNPI